MPIRFANLLGDLTVGHQKIIGHDARDKLLLFRESSNKELEFFANLRGETSGRAKCAPSHACIGSMQRGSDVGGQLVVRAKGGTAASEFVDGASVGYREKQGLSGLSTLRVPLHAISYNSIKALFTAVAASSEGI
jgi:hypothetical protein